MQRSETRIRDGGSVRMLNACPVALSSWVLTGGYLCFVSKYGGISTRFHTSSIDDRGELRAVGCYLFNATFWEHVLVLNPAWHDHAFAGIVASTRDVGGTP
jgi:hypothetical protein